MLDKKAKEAFSAAVKSLLAFIVLMLALSGTLKQEDENDVVPLYLLHFSEIKESPPQTYQNLIQPQEKLDLKKFFSFQRNEQSEKQESKTQTDDTQNGQPGTPVPKTYPSSQSFSSYYSKADYHYEEAERLIKKPKLLQKGEFVYPQKAYDRNIEGTYKARLWVSVEGDVINVEVIDVDDTFGFATAIKNMAKQFKYEPVIVRGLPIAFTIVVPFEFILGNDS